MAADDPEVLIRKAKQDELVLERLLGDQDVDDDTLGFHAQQAAEKLLKAAMAIRGLDYPRTHDLGALIDMLAKGGMTLPEDLVDIDLLTPSGRFFVTTRLWNGRVEIANNGSAGSDRCVPSSRQ